MSDHTMTGADLEHLEQLASAYSRSGATITARAAELRARLTRAVEAFEATTERLRADTDGTAATMVDEIVDLSAIAAGVAWTGANRAAFDDELHRFARSVRSASEALVDGLAAIHRRGVTPFAGSLQDFGAATARAGDGVETATSDLHRAVAAQREQLHEAADVGWTTA